MNIQNKHEVEDEHYDLIVVVICSVFPLFDRKTKYILLRSGSQKCLNRYRLVSTLQSFLLDGMHQVHWIIVVDLHRTYEYCV